MTEWKMKRFWKEAAPVAEDGGGFAVALDGRAIRTPAKARLVLPTEPLAEAVAREWQAVDEAVNPGLMPFTRSANAAIDKVAHQHAEVAALLADYGGTDLLCYRATAPEELVALQAEAWDPLLDWAAEALEARLHPVAGVMHQPQDPAALERLARRTANFDAFELTAFHDLVSLSGSLVLGFAVTEGHRDPETLWSLSRVDEDWQARQWGVDDAAAEAAAIKKQAFLHAARFHALVRG